MLQERSNRRPDTWHQNELRVSISEQNAVLGYFIYCHYTDDVGTTEIGTQSTEKLGRFNIMYLS